MQAARHQYPWRFSLFLSAYYATNAVYQGYITVYFRQVGISTQLIGVLMSAVPLVSIFTQPLWGSVADRSRNRTMVLRVLAIMAGLSILTFYFSSAWGYLLVMISLYSAFFTAVQPLGDSIILEALEPGRQPFGPIRLIACLAFALCSMLSGYLLEGRINWILPVIAGMLGLTTLSTIALPAVPGHQAKGRKLSMMALFRQHDLTELMLFMALLQMTMGYFYAFFSVHYTELPGGNSQLLGWCYLISAVSEVPFLLFSDKLFEKLGAGKLMCISALAMTTRWILLGFLSDVRFVMATQVLHGWGFIVLTVSMAKYINLTVPEELKSRGQMLLAVVGFGFARVAGSALGGLLAGALGTQRAFFVSAGVSLTALIIFAPRFLRKPPLNGPRAPLG